MPPEIVTLNLLAILPMLIVVGGALLVLLVDLVLPDHRKVLTIWLAAAGLVAALVVTLLQIGQTHQAFGGMLLVDGFTTFFNGLFIITALISLLISSHYLKRTGLQRGEFYALLMFSTSGMMVMAAAADLIIVFLGLELLSIPLYVMAGFARPRLDSEESAMKYFLLGAFSSAFFVYGVALTYGATGSTTLAGVSAALAGPLDDPLLVIGMGLLLVGLGFKVAAVPFHMWTPDVYQGAPTSVTAFMAVASKAASFGAFLRVFVEGLEGLKDNWGSLFLVVCIVTLILGNVVAIVQTNIKRMLAYSSIAHAGYALIGVVVVGQASVSEEARALGLSSVMLYMAVYAFMTFGAFAVVAALRRGGLEGEELEDFTGLAKRQPVAALIMLIFMVSLAGIPPTAGFIGKLYLLMAAVKADLTWLAVVAVLFAAVSAYYYLRVVMLMYMREPEPAGSLEPRMVASPAVSLVLAVTVAGVVFFGLFPNLLVSVTSSAVLPLK